MTTVDGQQVTFTALPANTMLPVLVSQVRTGATATNLMRLF